MSCIYCKDPACRGSCLFPEEHQYLGALGAFLAQQADQQAHKTKPLENGGLKVEDLIGWRLWAITPAGLLRSYSATNVWLPDTPMEGIPGDHDSMGVWAFKNEADCVAKLASSPNHRVMGTVLLWGQVVEHAKGYRAQYARIRSIDVVSLPGKYPWDAEVITALRWLREKYNLCPLG